MLFPDQVETLDKIYAEYRKGYKHVLLQAATGSGKSVIATYLIKQSMKKDNKIWFMVPRRELIRQMSETFSNAGIEHSFIAADYPYDREAKIFIVSLGSVIRRLDNLEAPHRLIVDEAHFGLVGLGNVITWAQNNGALTLGLSATPNRGDGKGLGKWFQTMVSGPSIKWLIENKRLASYRAFAPSRVDLRGISITAGDYNQKELAEKMKADKVLVGNAVAHYKKHAMGKLGVTFAVGVDHSKILCEAYLASGIPAAHMDGDTPEADRRRIARAFANREILQLCNSDLLTFGYDLASASGVKGVVIECMTDCKPTRSLPLQSQKWGRVLRYSAEPHLIFDHANNIETHGMPDEDREWTLKDKPKGKRGASEQAVQVRVCPACFFAHAPADECPECGHVYEVQAREIKQVEGELEEATTRKKPEKWKLKTLAELIIYGKKMGYKPGWAYIYAKSKGIR